MKNILILDNNITMHRQYSDYFKFITTRREDQVKFNLFYTESSNEFNDEFNEDMDLIIFEENINGTVMGIETVLPLKGKIPLLFISASNEKEDILQMKNENITTLTKPFSKPLFQHTVEILLNIKNI